MVYPIIHSEQVQNATKDLPEEQQEQIKGALGQAMQSGTQAVGAVGGGVKGVGDTVGNTVRYSDISSVPVVDLALFCCSVSFFSLWEGLGISAGERAQ